MIRNCLLIFSHFLISLSPDYSHKDQTRAYFDSHPLTKHIAFHALLSAYSQCRFCFMSNLFALMIRSDGTDNTANGLETSFRAIIITSSGNEEASADILSLRFHQFDFFRLNYTDSTVMCARQKMPSVGGKN